jgi:formate hydrogenlyase subunit 6/NADH:ubiquinone oxidoreductase subunit I
MEPLLVDRPAVEHLRRAIARQRHLFEVRHENGEAEWCDADLDAGFDWEAPLPLGGAKQFFFPPREVLLRWRGGEVEETVPSPSPFALFGLRSCDLTAIRYQDRFFATHPWYVHRRQQALLVGVNCLAACPGGFCRDVDAGPFAGDGFDLNLTPLGARVMVEVGSELGRQTLGAAGIDCKPADAPAQAALDAARDAAIASFPQRPFMARAMARINSTDADVRPTRREWQSLGGSCLACTGCTNLCPTCSCFTVIDEARGEGGERVRYWDSCLLEGFQREASGHHPAPEAGDRVRRFWYHKFSTDFIADFGRPGCVGCGRCDVTCPGSIGASAALARLGASRP